MKKYYFLLFFSLFCSCATTSKSPDDSTLISIQVIDRNGFAETVSNKDRLSRYQAMDFSNPQPYQKVLRVFGKNSEGKSSSRITSYHSNGHIWQYLEVMDGRANGTYKEWHNNGRIRMNLQVIEGSADLSDLAQNTWVFEGTNTIWDDQEHKIAEICYLKGMLHGDSIYYYPSGQIKKKISYFQDQVEGPAFVYAEDGNILETIPYKNDKVHGKAFAYDTKGNLLYEETFVEGILQEGNYYPENKKITTGITQGMGVRAEFEEGILKRLVQYKKGLPEGLVKCLNANGSLFLSFEQKDGKKHGEEKEYYPDSTQVKILFTWQEDVLQGPMKTWFPSGEQESQRELYQNKKNGPLYAWYKNGSLLLTEEYEKDLLMSGAYYKKGDKKPVSRISNGKGTATLYDPDGYFLKKIPYEKGLPLLEGEIP